MLRVLVAVASIVIASGCAEAKSLVDIGKEKSQVCASCHGVTGKAEIPIYPNLAGQNKIYLEMALKAYRDQSRKGMQAEAMYATAAPLSDDDIKALAAYFSSQSR